jgi:hypothetical protein
MMRKLCLLTLAVTITTLLASGSAKANSTLHIGPGAGTACATGCAGDPNLLGTGDVLDIFQNSGGANATVAQVANLDFGHTER